MCITNINKYKNKKLICNYYGIKNKNCTIYNWLKKSNKPSALFTGPRIANHCEGVISINLHKDTPRAVFLRCSGAKRQRCPCIHFMLV